ncbi:DENN/MADD domain containing 2Da isoform X1 [Tachysurus fulvidraco]|uniref:DENN/MADD domain containing 2Da isoform X1 n=1 Tax=Tachysurus fulvidraco TaxID=1234273 RepID=UPI000F4FC938|nr:DENN/MADD domain containing 2Da isoform X1 [Tachysurus fulvidraco]XP_027011000.1 DENN/MADD domain containing 2Da isoform X1 [Tachysurus fulvidraco]
MSRQSWGFSSLRLKSKRTTEDTDAFQRRGRLFSSLREDRRQKLSSVSEDGGAAEGGKQNISIENETEITKGTVFQGEDEEQDKGAMKRLSTMWMSVKGKMSRDRGLKEPESPLSPDAAPVDEQQREFRYASGQFFFEYLVVVSLKKNKNGTYEPQISYQFPKRDGLVRFQKEEEEKTLKAITLFCFPEGINWAPLTEYSSETFSFVLTEVDGSRRNGYCRRLLPHGNGARPPEAYCIISKVACFGLFSKIFDEVEKRRQIAMAMIYPFMQSLREAPFPAPGNTVQIKSFIPDSGTEIISLTRPTDSWLEHVDFRTLFRCLSDEEVLQVFAATVLERRIVFLAEELGTLSQVIHAVSVLLHPFIWQHTLIPIVPQILIDVVMAPTPYLLGVQKRLADEAIDQGDMLVVDLSEGRKETFIRRIGDEDSVLPHKLREEILQALRSRSEKSSLEELNCIVPEAFLPFFIKTVGHFSKHMVRNGADATAHFQKRSFCKAIESKSIRHFVKKFVQTQMFDLFIQEVEQRPTSQTGFFERKITEYHRKMREKAKKH